MVDLNIKIPDDFLKEEIRCDYKVTRQMKEVWAVMLDLLNELDRVCKKYNLIYYANGGTMLGAIRHKGFIPWDDDLDIMMMREDYERLMAIGPKEFKHPYFLQNKYTEPNAPTFFAKLRNSETTAFNKSEEHSFMEYNKGIFIDIFPLDKIPNEINEQKEFLKEVDLNKNIVINNARKIGLFSEDENHIKHLIKKLIYKMTKHKRKKEQNKFLHFFKNYENVCCKYKNIKTKKMTIFAFNELYYVSDFSNIVYKDFEFLKIPIPSGFHHSLKCIFGDYMTPKKYENHTSIFDTNKSYKLYF